MIIFTAIGIIVSIIVVVGIGMAIYEDISLRIKHKISDIKWEATKQGHKEERDEIASELNNLGSRYYVEDLLLYARYLNREINYTGLVQILEKRKKTK